MAPQFNRQAAADYAQKYALNYNQRWPSHSSSQDGGGDCTNFISQAMLAGGWKMVSYSDAGAWYSYVHGQLAYDRTSNSWAGAHPFKVFIEKSGRVTRCRRDELDLGDLVTLTRGEQGVHHMIVSKVEKSLLLDVPRVFRDAQEQGQRMSFRDPGPIPGGPNSCFLSYHSHDTLNSPLAEVEKKFMSGGSAYDGIIYWKLADYPR